MATEAPLKRLGFLQGYAATATSIAEGAYKKARALVPGAVEPYVLAVEDKTSSVAAPYLTWAQDATEKTLRTADGQVDNAVTALTGALNFSRELHDKNMATFKDAKEQYYTTVEKTFSGAKSKLDPSPVLAYLLEATRATLDKAVAYTDPDYVVDAARDALGKVAAVPIVAKALDLGSPILSFALKQYTSVHDSLVGLPAYKNAYGSINAALSSAASSPLYRRVVLDTLYPALAPVADPVIANVTKSKYIAQLAQHVRPAATA